MSESTTQIVIFGGTGDLAKRKLLHALFDLDVKGKLPENTHVTGVATGDHTDESYRELVHSVLNEHDHEHSDIDREAFCTKVSYVKGNFTEDEVFHTLESKLTEQGGGNKIFYLAIPPTLYETVFTKLAESDIANQDDSSGYARVLVEKPFGSDLQTAQKLDERLSTLFSEDQIFRIDHYLAKEAVQNILSFRFANTFFRSPWDNHHIAAVHVTMHETIDVGKRASFYEGVGALRDVGQNHLLQLVALIAMAEPKDLTANEIRKKRAEALADLRLESSDSITDNVSRAQYEGYADAEGVEEGSTTETYFKLTSYIDNETWYGVPFHISAGKGLSESFVAIEVHFKDVATGPFETNTCLTTENVIRLDISPEQKMSITLNAKAPGLGYQVESRTLEVACDAGEDEITNSYEKVLLDALRGDQTLFTTTEEVLAAWHYITSILDNWESVPLTTYKKGTTPEV